MNSPLAVVLKEESVRHRRGLVRGAACAAAAAAAATCLLGVSGWFIAASAAAGLAGAAAAQAFNYMLPSAAIRLMAIARTGARYGERLLHHEAALATMARVRPMIFGAICAAGPRHAAAVSVGDAATALTQDCAAVEDRLARRGAGWGAAASVAAGVALAAVASWASAVAVLAVVGALFGVARWVAPAVGRADARARANAAALKDDMAFLAAAEPELRCYGLQAWAGERAAAEGRALSQAQAAQVRSLSRMDVAQAACTGLAAAAGLWLAADAGAPLAALAGLAGAMAVDGAGSLARTRALRAGFDAAAGRIDAHLRAGVPVPGATGIAPDATSAERGARSPGATGSALGAASTLPGTASACTGNASDWPGTAPTLHLQALGLAVAAPGRRIALVGPSGSGKTSLFTALLGLRPLAAGQVALAGRDAAGLDAAQRAACFAWLPQDALLVAGTVRDNLALAAPEADDAALWRALAHAAIDDRVRRLPAGLDSWIGEDGDLLSGGERRRLALARTYASGAPWLLLDEPTEGLDAATEARVLDGLRAHLARTGQGVVMATHRPAAAAFCDEVLRVGLRAA